MVRSFAGSGSGGDRQRLGRRPSEDKQDLHSRLPAFEAEFLRDAISYLFSNFPDGWTSEKLWYVFAMYGAGLGRLADVFIPKRKDRKGGNYGFVRFKDVKNLKLLEDKLNSIWFGQYKLRVTTAAQRNRRNSHFVKAPNGRSDEKMKNVVQNINNKGSNERCSKDKTFKQALMEGLPSDGGNNIKITELLVDEADLNQLHSCAVGELLEYDSLTKLEEELWCNGFQFELVPMGGSLVLLRGGPTEQLASFINKEEDVWNQWFKKLVLWSQESTPKERFAWLKFSCVPLQAWNQENFQSLGNCVGTFIASDVSTANKTSLDAIRIFISTSEMNLIRKELKVKVQGEELTIFVSEEGWRLDPWWLNSLRKKVNHGATSFSSKSSESEGSCAAWRLCSDGEDDGADQKDHVVADKSFGDSECSKNADFINLANSNLSCYCQGNVGDYSKLAVSKEKNGAALEKQEHAGFPCFSGNHSPDRTPLNPHFNTSLLNPLPLTIHEEHAGFPCISGEHSPDLTPLNPQNNTSLLNPLPLTSHEEHAGFPCVSGVQSPDRTPLNPLNNSAFLNPLPITIHEKSSGGFNYQFPYTLGNKRGKKLVWDCYPFDEKLKFLSKVNKIPNLKRKPNQKELPLGSDRNSSAAKVSDSGILKRNLLHESNSLIHDAEKILDFGKRSGFCSDGNDAKLISSFVAMEERDGAGQG